LRGFRACRSSTVNEPDTSRDPKGVRT
jgi:hypothetical protein